MPAAAFDVELQSDAARASLRLADGPNEQLVADVSLHEGPVAPRILVDGSMVEIFDGTGTAFTTRAYPTATSRWILRLGHPVPLRAWRLGP